MNCQEFEDLWNERLDHRGAASPELEHALEKHATQCPECRARGARFLLLSHAIGNLPPVRPPAAFVDDCMTALQRSTLIPNSGRAVWLRRLAAPLATAACLTLIVLVGLRPARPAHRPEASMPAVPDATSFPDALADATSATWQLALETSAPAARIGRDVLDSAVDQGSSAPPALLPSAASTASGVLQTVGERVNEGVRPLSGSARHAFGFLLGPALDEDRVSPAPFVTSGLGSATIRSNARDYAEVTPMRRLFLLTLTFFAIVRFQPAVSARGDEVADSLLRLAPPDAGMTLLVENLHENARRSFESSIGKELGKLPSVRAWRASERGQGLQQAKRQIEKVIGESITTLRDELLGDAFALVLHLGPDEMPDQAHGLLLTRVRNKALLDRVIQEFNSAQVRKGEVTRVVSKSWQGAGYSARVFQDPKRPTEFYATLGETFAWSNSEKLLQGVLERHADGTPGLAQTDRFRRVHDKLPRRAALSLFVDAGFLRRSLSTAPQPKRSANEERVAAIFERYLGALEYAGAAVEWNDGVTLQIEESLQADRLDPWIKAWAASGAKTSPDMRRVPSTALAVGNLYVDFPAFLQAIESVIPEEGRTKYGNLLELMKGVLLGRDVRKEILPYLGPAVLAYFEAPQKGDSVPGLPFVLSVDVGGDSQVGPALENALRTLLAMVALDDKLPAPGPTLETQQIQGARVTSLRPGSPFAFTVTGGRLVLGRSPESVARALGNGPKSSLAELRAVYFPDKTSFACFDLAALKAAAELHRTDLVKRLASRNRHSEEAQAQDLDQVLGLIGLFRAAYITSAMAPDATSVHRTAGLIARDPAPSSVR